MASVDVEALKRKFKKWIIKNETIIHAIFRSKFVEQYLIFKDTMPALMLSLLYDPLARIPLMVESVSLQRPAPIPPDPSKAKIFGWIKIICPKGGTVNYRNTKLPEVNLFIWTHKWYACPISEVQSILTSPNNTPWRSIVAYMNSKRLVDFDTFMSSMPTLTNEDIHVESVKESLKLKTCCDHCQATKKVESLLKCGHCYAVVYCSKECQVIIISY
jgi:hypothetical protein